MMKTPRPTTATLQAFECAARNGSFTRAAIELSVTQGNISRRIRRLEKQLGVMLFNVVKQRVVLTEVGKQYWDEVRRALDQLEHATQRAMACADVGHVITARAAGGAGVPAVDSGRGRSADEPLSRKEHEQRRA